MNLSFGAKRYFEASTSIRTSLSWITPTCPTSWCSLSIFPQRTTHRLLPKQNPRRCIWRSMFIKTRNEHGGKNIVATVATTVSLSFKCGIIYNTAIRDGTLPAITAAVAGRGEKCVRHMFGVARSYLSTNLRFLERAFLQYEVTLAGPDFTVFYGWDSGSE